MTLGTGVLAVIAIVAAIALGQVGHSIFYGVPRPQHWTQNLWLRMGVFLTMIVAAAGAGESYRGEHTWLVSYVVLCALPSFAAFLWFRRRDH